MVLSLSVSKKEIITSRHGCMHVCSLNCGRKWVDKPLTRRTAVVAAAAAAVVGAKYYLRRVSH